MNYCPVLLGAGNWHIYAENERTSEKRNGIFNGTIRMASDDDYAWASVSFNASKLVKRSFGLPPTQATGNE